MTETESSVFSRDLLSMLYALLASLGIAFYVSWSYLYGTWTDIGVYAVTIVMVGFGIIGYMLYSIEE
ncbi:MAG: hypothetical protein V5A88_01195 [Candidatus Thermoplasmatota archaeon]